MFLTPPGGPVDPRGQYLRHSGQAGPLHHPQPAQPGGGGGRGGGGAAGGQQ